MEGVRYAADIFQVRPEWLIFPNVVTIFAVPLILNILMFYFIIKKFLPQFAGFVAIVISGIIGFLLLPYNQLTMLAAPAIIGFLGPRNVALKILIAVGLYALVFLVVPIIAGEIVRLPFF